eukprot:2528465-Pyramimonas_sp.AAC.1
MMTLRSDYVDDLYELLKTKIADHCSAVLAPRGEQGDCGEIHAIPLSSIASMIGKASKIWPLSEKFPPLKAILAKVEALHGQSERCKTLVAAAIGAKEHVAERAASKQYDLDPDIMRVLYDAVGQMDQTPMASYPDEINQLWELVLEKLVSRVTLQSTCSKSDWFALLLKLEQ